MIINELGLCLTRSNNVYFANNEQVSLAFTDVFCFAYAEHNYLCDFVVRVIKIAAYLESPREINFNLVGDFLSK